MCSGVYRFCGTSSGFVFVGRHILNALNPWCPYVWSVSDQLYGHIVTYINLLENLNVDLIAFMGSVITVLGLIVLGAPLVHPRNGGPVVAFAAGMGGMVTLFSVSGTIFYYDFKLVALVLCGIVLLAGLLSYRAGRLGPHLSLAIGTTIAVAVLAIVVSGRIASEWDEFSHWLHAFRYLFENNRFPGPPDATPMYSCCAAYPYGWPLLAYLTSMASGFIESIPAVLNILILGLFGGLLAQLAQPERVKPAFPVIAVGVLGATLLGTTFVSKLVFSTYADNITSVMVAVAAYLAYRINQALEEKDATTATQLFIALALVGTALLSVKPGNLVLYVIVLGSGSLLFLRSGAWREVRWPAVLVIVLPALVYVLWRNFVDDYLSGQELVILQFSDWKISLIPQILWSMLLVAGHKSGYFLLMAVSVALGIRGFIRMRTDMDRLAVIVGLLFLGYNVFLLFTYVAVFGKNDALRVASYWRYNTHLGLAGTLVAFLLLRQIWDRFIGYRPVAHSKWLMVLPIALLVIAPFAFLKSVRFDINPMKTFIRETTRELPSYVPPGSTMSIYDPEGTGLATVMSLYEWQGRVRYSGQITAFSQNKSPDVFLAPNGAEYLFVMSGHHMSELIPDQPVALLLSRAKNWEAIASFPFPEASFPKRFP